MPGVTTIECPVLRTVGSGLRNEIYIFFPINLSIEKYNIAFISLFWYKYNNLGSCICKEEKIKILLPISICNKH